MISCANRGIHGRRTVVWKVIKANELADRDLPWKVHDSQPPEETPLLRGANLERMTAQSANETVRGRC